MVEFGGSLGRWIRRARGVEPFVRRIVGGGLALVAGLWLSTRTPAWSPVWIGGIALVGVGIGGLASGIWSEVDY